MSQVQSRAHGGREGDEPRRADWLAESAARAEHTLLSLPSASLGPAGRRLLAAMAQASEVAWTAAEDLAEATGEESTGALKGLPTHPRSAKTGPVSRQLPLTGAVRDLGDD